MPKTLILLIIIILLCSNPLLAQKNSFDFSIGNTWHHPKWDGGIKQFATIQPTLDISVGFGYNRAIGETPFKVGLRAERIRASRSYLVTEFYLNNPDRENLPTNIEISLFQHIWVVAPQVSYNKKVGKHFTFLGGLGLGFYYQMYPYKTWPPGLGPGYSPWNKWNADVSVYHYLNMETQRFSLALTPFVGAEVAVGSHSSLQLNLQLYRSMSSRPFRSNPTRNLRSDPVMPVTTEIVVNRAVYHIYQYMSFNFQGIQLRYIYAF